MSAPESLQCPTCSASFRRAEHLRRHHTSHSPYRPFKCHCCKSSFKRRDVLRKHLAICSTRIESEIPMPDSMAVGKKATSCDQCAHSKKACDRKLPCSSCLRRLQHCTFERQLASKPFVPHNSDVEKENGDNTEIRAAINHDFDDYAATPFSTEWLDWDDAVQFLAQQLPPSPDSAPNVNAGQTLPPTSSFNYSGIANLLPLLRDNTAPQHSFDFLWNFTHTSSLQDTFNYKRRRHCHKPLKRVEFLTDVHEANSDLQPPGTNVAGNSSNNDFSHSDPPPKGVTLASLMVCLDDPLFAQTKAIWDIFRAYKLRVFPNVVLSREDAASSDERCLAFFNPSNLRKFMQLFWDEWYPHCPIIHKTTFDILHVPTLLLVPMVLIGACMSPLSHDKTIAKEWLEFAEELVFSSTILSAEASERPAPHVEVSTTKILQAAYLTCILLNWEGSDTIKRRVRHHRSAAVISAVREIGLSTANHFPRDYVNAADFDWEAFVEREETIRTFTYVFLLDTAFIIFNNTPPRMILQELALEMTAPELCFQAYTATDCYTHWQQYLGKYRNESVFAPMHLFEAIGALLQNGYDEDSIRFKGLSILNLFAIVAGLHTVLFQHQSLLSYPPPNLSSLRTALTRWEHAWANRNNIISCAAWQDEGFIRHAQEFTWLALARLDVLESSSKENLDGISNGQPLKPASGRLDDTSMSLVTEFMMSLSVTR